MMHKMTTTTMAEPQAVSNGVANNAPVPMEAEKSDPLTEAIEKIIIACEGRNDSRSRVFEAPSDKNKETVDRSGGGSLRSQELTQLSRLCTAAASPSTSINAEKLDFGAVEGEVLASLFQLLEEHVRSAAKVDLVGEACQALEPGKSENESIEETNMTVEKWLRGSPESPNAGPGMKRFFVLKNGLEAASILVSIMTAPRVDRRIVSEDCIDACIALTRQHLSKNIIPAIGHTGHITAQSAAEPTPKKPKKSPKKSETKEERLMRNLKQVYKHILSSSNLILGLLEHLDRLILSVPLEDRMSLMLVTSALSVFAVEPAASAQSAEARLCHLLHVASISLLTNIFQKYRQHQTFIIQDLFPLMLKLPTSKRSLRTFIIHTETDTSAVTVNRALFHSSKHSGQEQHCIQAITVLILSLIQCCVEMPTFHDATTEQTELPQLKSGLGQCQAVCNIFAAQLLQRCARKGEDGGASEYRPILGRLVDDLLLLLLSPEYPGAEMLLLTLNRNLFNDVLKASSIVPKTAHSSNVEATYLTTAFDVIGKIQAAVAGILAAYKAKPLKISKSGSDDKPAADNGLTENSCHCGRTNIQALMVNCDDCKGWYHGECVAITKNNVPHVWVCDDCRLKEMVVGETRAFAQQTHRNQPEGVTGSLSECVSDTHILRQLLLNYMTEESNTSDSPAEQYARHVHLAQWIEEMCASQNSATESNDTERTKMAFVSRLLCDHFLQQWDVPQASECLAAKNDHTVGSSSRRCLNKEGNARLMLNLAATKSTLVVLFPKKLGWLLKLMADESQTSIRKLSVKAISQVLEADPMLMLHRSVKTAVAERFADDAKSVREASVSLVGTFVVKSPAIANAFHSSLLKCLSDDGVSVKKRAVKIFRDVLLSNPLYKGRAMACAVMLRQASDPKEDDSVRDLIHAFFTEFWLESDPSVPVPNYNGLSRPDPSVNVDSSSHANDEVAAGSPSAGAGIVTPLTPHGSSAIEPNEAAQCVKKKRQNTSGPCSPRQTRGFLAAEQMVEVVMAAESKEVLTSLLKELMTEFTDADKDRKASERKKRTVALRSQCAYLVDALMEQLLVLEESRPSLGNSFGKKLVALFRAVAVFGEIAPAEVLRHLDTITPYLKAENSVAHEHESQIVSEICELIFQLAPLMSSRDILRLTDGAVIDDLVGVTYRFGSGPLSTAMRALANLAKHKAAEGDNVISKKLMKLVGTFYSYLLKNKQSERDFSKADVKTRNNTSRALSVLGAFCRNHEVDEEDWPDVEDVDDIDAQELTPTTVMYACYSLFVYYLQQDDINTKCSALRALTGIFISRPRVMLMLEQDGTIEEIMSSESPTGLQLESLRCWKEILLSEEKRVDSGDAKARMKAKAGMTLSKQISGDLDGDATLVGGVVGQHAPRLFQMTTSQDHRVRLASVDLLGNLLRMGLLNPMETVPYLFAVQGDVETPSVRALALRLLIIEGEKRPDMLRQRGLAGVKQAYKFQRTVYPSKLEATAVVKRERGKKSEVECIFGCVFKECIRNSKKQRLGLYRSLLSLFTSDPADDEQFGRPKKTAAKKKDQDLPLLSFASQVLAHLPYATASDPLFIIHHLSGTTAIQGVQILDRLSSFLREYGLSSSDELDNNHGEDALEVAAKAKSPSRSKEISAINNADFDVSKFAELCGEACAIVLLLRLKLFLRKIYNLSETRCLEYSPDAKERICDQKHISAPADMPTFDASLKMKSQDKKGKTRDNKDALIRQYAEFRKLMREEQSADHARMTDSEGEPTPPSRKRKSSEAS